MITSIRWPVNLKSFCKIYLGTSSPYYDKCYRACYVQAYVIPELHHDTEKVQGKSKVVQVLCDFLLSNQEISYDSKWFKEQICCNLTTLQVLGYKINTL